MSETWLILQPHVPCGVVLLLRLVVHCNFSYAVTYTVGGDEGWDYNASPWPLDKNFKAGDVLVFNYKPYQRNVVVVNEQGYDSCNVPPGSKIYNTGLDSIPLVKGSNFFISSIGQDCQNGVQDCRNGVQMLVYAA